MSYSVHSTVITAASSTLLVALSVIKEELGIVGSGLDAQLTRYIAAASTAAASYCRRVFVVEGLLDEFSQLRAQRNSGGEAVLLASRFPIVDVTSFVLEGEELVAGTDYRLNKETGALMRLDADTGASCAWRCLPSSVAYTAGFAVIPADVQDAVVRMVRGRWFAKDRDPLVRQESIPGVRDVSYWIPTGQEAGNMPPDVIDLLDGYRLPLIG